MSDIGVVVTGTAWVGSGFGSIETAFKEEFELAKDEILLTVYCISTSGDLIFPLLERALQRGLLVRMIVNRFAEQPLAVRNLLHEIGDRYPHFQLFDFCPVDRSSDLHAKTLVFDRRRAIVGSSNLSKRGFTTNHELSLVISGVPASDVAVAIDRLTSHRSCKRLPPIKALKAV